MNTGKTDEAEICDTLVSITNSQPKIKSQEGTIQTDLHYTVQGGHQRWECSSSNDQILIIGWTLSTSIEHPPTGQQTITTKDWGRRPIHSGFLLDHFVCCG